MSMSVVTQRQSLAWSGSAGSLRLLLDRIGGPGTVEVLEEDKKFKVFNCVEVIFDGKIVIMEWPATPTNDMFADAVLAALLQSDLCGSVIRGTTAASKPDRMHFKECLIETLQDMFGENSVPKMFKGENLNLNVNGVEAIIDLESLVSLATDNK